MRLWLLRHGEAQRFAPQDALRALTEQGRQEVLESASRLRGRPLEAILASPYLRARQTAELVAQALDYPGVVEIQPWLTPDSDPADALDQLFRRPEAELLVVTHQPFVGSLAGLLLHGHRQSPLPMGTAALLGLQGDYLLAGGMERIVPSPR
jgi:phosphohistidine phosphatase